MVIARYVLRAALVGLVLLALSPTAHAQAPRTWVSGVGDDVNPCSRTAPCKTFAGAISKTAPGGTINVLDNGAFGTVTITKAITIQNDGSFAGILSSNTTGIIVNAGASDNIVLRGLSIEGSGTGFDGIRFLNGLSLIVENCQINRVTEKGIKFIPSGASQLYVKDTVIRNSNFAAGAGIFIQPGAAGSAQVTIEHVQIERNAIGIEADDRSKVSIRNSEISRNSSDGVRALSTVGGVNNSVINVVGSLITLNTGAGVRADGTGALIRITGNAILNNGGTGIQPINGGVIQSFGNNQNAGNSPDGAPSSVLSQQ